MPGNLHKGSRFLADYAGIVSKMCETNPGAADQFCDSIERALDLLEKHPQIGAKAGFRHAPQIRKWLIQRFPNYLLFYEERAEGVVVIRLLHGARRLPRLIPPE